jgi:hypothetical protein
MSTNQLVIERVRQCTATELQRLAEASGVPLPTLTKIKYGQTPDPRGSTLDAIAPHLPAPQAQPCAAPAQAA